MNCVDHIIKVAPEAALFAAVGLGHALGRLKLWSFSLGGVAGSLVVALLIGQVTGVNIPELLKAVCFGLFIYAVGFKSGPEFFAGLNASSLKLVLSSTVQCLAALATVLVLARLCKFGKGFSAGMGAGALTQTAMLGTAAGAFNQSSLTPEQISEASSQMAVAFAITYVFGTLGVIIFVRTVAPRLLGVDPKQAAQEFEKELGRDGGKLESGDARMDSAIGARAFKVTVAAGKQVATVLSNLGRASVEKLIRSGEVLQPLPSVVLQEGDILGIVGRVDAVRNAATVLGPEVENRDALNFSAKASNVVLTSKSILNQNLGYLRRMLAKPGIDAVYLSSLKRQGLELPILAGTVVRFGDVAEIVGRPEEVQEAARLLGRSEVAGGKSDLAYHGLAIVCGVLLGSLSVLIGGVPVTLGVGGGVLIAGLCFGWLHSRYPVYGSLPAPAQWLLCEFGLSAFAAAIGLAAGPRAVAAIQQQGISLLLAGMAVTLIPLFVAFAFGRYVLRLHPVILLGAICGGQTVAAALSAVTEATDSTTPVLGFTMTYAIANVLLAVWGPLIVAFT